MFVIRFIAVSLFCIVSFGNNDSFYRQAEVMVGDKNSFLNAMPEEVGTFIDLLECCFRCLSMGFCRSMNTKPVPNGFICQFLRTNKEGNQSQLKYSQGWTHYENREVGTIAFSVKNNFPFHISVTFT